MVKVSVIVSVYNSEKYLRRCIESLLNQTLKEIEIIFINDGSTDSSLEILQNFKKNDPRIILINQNNLGAGAARNKGLSLAKGEYLSFLDSDDFYERNMLKKAYLKSKKYNADITVFKSDFFNNDKSSFSKCNYSINKNLLPKRQPFSGIDIKKDRFKAFVGWAWDKLFKREFITKLDLKFQEQRTSNDLFFVFSALIKANNIITINQILIHQRRNLMNSLSNTREKSWECFYKALIELRKQFIKWNVYHKKNIEQDFINYALHFSLWNLNTLKLEKQENLYLQLKKSWFKELKITDYDESYFYNKLEYKQYKEIMNNTFTEYLFNKIRTLESLLDNKYNILNDDIQGKIQSIYNSVSFKIGRFITYLPRKLVFLMKNLKSKLINNQQ